MVKLQEIQFTRDNNKNIEKKNYRNDRNVSCVSVCVRVNYLLYTAVATVILSYYVCVAASAAASIF